MVVQGLEDAHLLVEIAVDWWNGLNCFDKLRRLEKCVKNVEESSCHLFINCSDSRQAWDGFTTKNSTNLGWGILRWIDSGDMVYLN